MNRKIIVAAILVGASLLAFLQSYLLLQSMKLASVVYVGSLGLTILFIEPFVGLINYLIFLYIRPHEFMPSLTGLPIMLLISAGTTALLLINMIVSKRHRYFARAPQNYLMLWFLLAITLSHVVTLFLPSLIEETMGFVTIVLMYFLIANLVSSERKLKITYYLLVLLTVTLAVSGIVQSFTGVGLGGQDMYKGSRIRGIGIFSDPNDLALAMSVMLPFLFFKLMDKKDVLGKLPILAFLGACLFALFLTESRGGLLALGVLAILLFSRRFGYAIGIGAGSLMMGVAFALSSRMSTISTEEGSALGRIEAWSVGFELLAINPLFGIGAGNFTEHHFRTAHNSFVLCFSELGLFGYYAWLMLIYISIRNLTFVSREMHMTEGGETLALYADSVRYGLVAFCACAFFLSRTYNEVLYVLLALAATVTHMGVQKMPGRYKLIERRDWVNVLIIMFGSLLFLKFFLIWAW